MYRLENAQIAAEFDALGRLSALSGVQNVIDSPAEDSFLLVFKKGADWENVVFGGEQAFSVSQQGNALHFHTDSLRYRKGTAQIALTLSVFLEEDSLRFGAAIENREPGALITDFEYPRIGMIKTLCGGKPSLLYPEQSGVRVQNIADYLTLGKSGKEGCWAGRETGSNTYGGTYPGVASMQWMALEDGGQTLSLASYDPNNYATALKVQAEETNPGAVTLLFDKMAFAKEGERWQAPEARLHLYTGSWHHSADAYAAAARAWRPAHKVPEWVRKMTGYYLVIMKQQFGTEMCGYADIPKLYDMAKEVGCDTVGLFGWYASGHDNQYPDLEASESMGGAESLREGIRNVRERGGNVTLYYQGHLIDVGTDFYKNGGDRMITRSKDGVPYFEQYNKAHNSSYMRLYTRKTFATACPSCPEWRELMENKAEWVASFGPSGVLYDQIGGLPPRPCFDESHPHPQGKPSLSMPGGRKLLLDGIQRHTKEIDPEYAFFSENIVDVYSAYLDAVHGIGSYPGAMDERGAHKDTPMVQKYPELFRYSFPETIITIRNQRPLITKRVCNFACTFGFCYELELRYDADFEDAFANRFEEENRYAKQVSELRKRHWELLGNGKFVDTLPLSQDNPSILSKAFQNEDKLAVVLWNDSEREQPLRLKVPGWKAGQADSPEGMLAALPETMQPQQLAVQLFSREAAND